MLTISNREMMLNIILHPSVLVFYCFHNKLPETHWLNTHKFVISQFWWSGVWHRFHWAKIKESTGLHSFLEAVRKNLFSGFLQLLESSRCSPMIQLMLLQVYYHLRSQKEGCFGIGGYIYIPLDFTAAYKIVSKSKTK